MEIPGCTAVTLISSGGLPYWFRTCDIGGDIWAQGAHMVSFPKGEEIELTGRESICSRHAFLGVTHNGLDTWLLDGVNDAGLTGGLLALYEGTSVPAAGMGREGVMGMELVTWFLAGCSSVDEVVELAGRMQVLDVPVGEGKTTAATMHCMFTEPSGRCVILEAANRQRPGELTVYRENPGMMTNSPPYPAQLDNLSWYLAHSPEWCWGKGPAPELSMNGMTVKPCSEADHVSMSGTFPASYAACDRFIRMAMLKYLNHEGRDITDGEMLPLGAQLMSAVIEPHNQGMYHYTLFDQKDGPQGGHESYTQYLVMYDVTDRAMYLKPYGSTGWTRRALEGCPKGGRKTHAVCRSPLAGVVKDEK